MQVQQRHGSATPPKGFGWWLTTVHNHKAPLEENRQKVLLQVTDTTTTASSAERAGLDLVAVLDVSTSMGLNRLDKLKTAMKFVVISKLGPMDRLSIVSFSKEAKVLCPLRCMTEAAKADLASIVDDKLKAEGSTNMHDGLVKALQVLDGRRHKSSRVASILFMSDGKPDKNHRPDFKALRSIGDVAVYTFAFGAGKDDKEGSTAVLEAIAGNSLGGTFYNVEDGENLSDHFSALLDGLLSVVVHDLKLTVRERPGYFKIEKVDAGSYPTVQGGDNAGTFVVDFGYLYGGEVRNVLVDLVLPAVSTAHREPVVLTAQCTYSIKGSKSPRARLLSCCISRTGSAHAGATEPEEVKVEEIRRHHAIKLGEAIETKNIDHARGKLQEAEDAALGAEPTIRNHLMYLIHQLKAELEMLLMLTSWEKLVACLRAAKRSHDVQRFASVGDAGLAIYKPRRTLTTWEKLVACLRRVAKRSHLHDDVLAIYKPRRMHGYVDQARKFDDQGPSRSAPPSVEDAERSVAEDRHQPQEQPQRRSRVWAGSRERSSTSPGWAWAAVLACTALAAGAILAGVAVLAVYLLYMPNMPYLAVSDARLELLQYGYGQGGAIDYLQASITVLAVNNNSKAVAAFCSMGLVLGFHGTDVVLLQAERFVVTPGSSLPLPYNVVSAGRALDAAGMQAMDEALRAGVVPFDLSGKARTRWKVGVFANLRFWTRISCRIRFFFPGNGTVVPTDLDKCRSR